jgi:hypothetical protein
MLIKKQDFLEKKIEQEISIARKNAAKNKRGIGRCLCIAVLTSTRSYEPSLRSRQHKKIYALLNCFNEGCSIFQFYAM